MKNDFNNKIIYFIIFIGIFLNVAYIMQFTVASMEENWPE